MMKKFPFKFIISRTDTIGSKELLIKQEVSFRFWYKRFQYPNRFLVLWWRSFLSNSLSPGRIQSAQNNSSLSKKFLFELDIKDFNTLRGFLYYDHEVPFQIYPLKAKIKVALLWCFFVLNKHSRLFYTRAYSNGKCEKIFFRLLKTQEVKVR